MAPVIETQRSSATNWSYTDFQLDCYRALLVDYEKYVAALHQGERAVIDPRVRFIASMRQFCLSVQYLFYAYLEQKDEHVKQDGLLTPDKFIEADYSKDKKKYSWKYGITVKDYELVHSPSFRLVLDKKGHGYDDVLSEMLSILNNWAQQYGCFKTYNEKLQYADFWDKIDAENS